MKNKFLFFAALTSVLLACGESTEKGEKEEEAPATETAQKAEDEKEESTAPLAAINDKSKRAEGAVECVAKQYALVKAGKFDEAMEYYSSRIRAKVNAELAANPAIKKDWQAATNLSEAEYQDVLKSVRETPDLFVFEDGMWRMDQR